MKKFILAVVVFISAQVLVAMDDQGINGELNIPNYLSEGDSSDDCSAIDDEKYVEVWRTIAKNEIHYLDKDCSILPTSDDCGPINSWLLQAAIEGNLERAQSLLKQKANVNTLSMANKTPLHEAIDADNYEMVELLLKNGADPAFCPNDVYHPIGEALGEDHDLIGPTACKKMGMPPYYTGRTPLDKSKAKVLKICTRSKNTNEPTQNALKIFELLIEKARDY